MPSFNFSRLSVLDNIEMFSSENENEYFPFHYHDFYCVSLITKGIEVLENTEQQFIAPEGTISITQVNEVHRNYSFANSVYSYKTLYLNPDILKFYNKGNPVDALQRVIYDAQLFKNLQALFTTKDENLQLWNDAIINLAEYKVSGSNKTLPQFSFSIIDELIEAHAAKPIDTDWLSKKFCMSKFHFIRAFKNSKGVPPQTYIMLYRLEKAKKMLLENMPLNDIAYINGFSHPSHFTNSFKRYFGIPPSQYLNCILK